MKTMTEKILELRKLNFTDLIALDIGNLDGYTFPVHLSQYKRHHPIKGFCISCEQKNCNFALSEPDFRLQNISHGAHSSDFISSLPDKPDDSTWHKEPVMFVYESPSIDYGIYEQHVFEGFTKRPAKDWYWVHNTNSPVSFPQNFAGGRYGDYVLSAILTFKLANVYMTNLVKCGLNNDQNNFRGISEYKPECIQNCFQSLLKREIDIHQPLVIFAVGSTVESWLRHFLPKDSFIQQIPHPAGRRRGFRDEHYKVLYFWLVVRALHKAGILRENDISELTDKFLTKYSQQ